jgi:hypothetical protein
MTVNHHEQWQRKKDGHSGATEQDDGISELLGQHQ